MVRPKLLDLFCGAGGAAMGYSRAGFDVVGVDSADRLRYPFERRIADAIEYLDAGGWLGFDAIHASPPCQRYTSLARDRWASADDHPDLIAPIRERLDVIGIPYVIENVPTAPLRAHLLLCGTMFNLGTGAAELRRHRLFEISPPILIPTPPCTHGRRPTTIGVYGHAGGWSARDGGRHSSAEWREAMGIPWMVGSELSEAIPPVYTELIGSYLIGAIR